MKHTLLLVSFALLTEPVHPQWARVGTYTGRVQTMVVHNTVMFAGTATSGVLRSSDHGTTWVAVNTGLTVTAVEELAVRDTILFAATWGGGVFRSTDYGEHWVPKNAGLTNNIVTALVRCNRGLFAGTWGFSADGVFRSTDDGETWTQVVNGLTMLDIEHLSACDSLIYASTWNGIFVSSNGGNTWQQPDSTVTYVEVVGVNAGERYAGTYGSGAFRSTDFGVHWIQVNNGLTDWDVETFAFTAWHVFAGTWGGGVCRSTDHGLNWTAINTGFGYNYVGCLLVADSFLYAGANDGVWRRPLSQILVGVDDDAPRQPTEFSLEQNYPNPFNPKTNITFHIANVDIVTLAIYDVLGREVATLVNEVRHPGTYTVDFDASELSSGVYIYRMQAGDGVRAMKLVVVK
jgi:hypothetical protein